MRKLFVITMALTLLTGLAAAQAPLYTRMSYPAQYWIVGTAADSLDGTDAGKAEGKTATLHTKGNPNEVIATTVVSGNRYKINALETYFVPVGEYEVSIKRLTIDGYGAGPTSVTITGAGWDQGPTLTLAKYAGAGPSGIAGKVTLPDGTTPISDVTISVTQNGNSAGSTTTNAQGEYSIALNPGNYNVSVQKAGYQPPAPQSVTVTVVANQVTTGVDFEMTPIVPIGTVQLFISRDAGDIKISWTTDAVPDIYYLTGNGTGQFNNSEGWTVVVPGQGKFSVISEKSIKHMGQVGGGIPEVYYKGLVAGQNPSAVHPKGGTYISQALAVGKVDVGISRVGATGWNLIAYSFEDRDVKDSLFGDFSNSDEIKIWNETEKKFLPSAVKFSEGLWGSYELERGKGYWLYRSIPTPIIATMIGKVQLDPKDIKITRKGATGWNFVGLPFLAGRKLSLFGPADASPYDEFKVWDESVKKVTLTYPKSVWGDQNILPAKGYFYYRAILEPPLEWKITW